MNETSLDNGWLPAVDCLVESYGAITAAVFGRIWKYCLANQNRVCREPLWIIASDLGLSRQTVTKAIKVLCADGFLQELTPPAINLPRIYKDTGKINMDQPEAFPRVYRFDPVEPSLPLLLHKTPRKKPRPKFDYNKVFIILGRRDGFRCRKCHNSGTSLQIDHIRPVSKGGTNALANLQLLCARCNQAKSDHWDGSEVPEAKPA